MADPAEKTDAYPPPHNPAYPPIPAEQQAPPPYPQEQPGYPPQQPGYPPQQPGYPPPTQPGYPPQQPGYPPPQTQQAAATTVVVTQPAVTLQTPVFRDRPVVVTDSNGQQVTTQVQFRSGILTWLICCLICWITGCWCIALIPFCIDATKDAYHITPTDGKIVGVYKRL